MSNTLAFLRARGRLAYFCDGRDATQPCVGIEKLEELYKALLLLYGEAAEEQFGHRSDPS